MHEAPQPDPNREELMMQIDSAREATRQSDEYRRNFAHGGRTVEVTMGAIDAAAPRLETTAYGTEFRVDAKTINRNKDTGAISNYHAFVNEGRDVLDRPDTSNPSKNYEGATVTRTNDQGEKVYEHRFKNPKAVGALIAKQVAQRAEVKAEQKLAA